MRDLRTLALTQKNAWRLHKNVDHRTGHHVQKHLGGPSWPRGGKTKRKRKTKRR
jgi:hypothetical protein